jgi:hypothetical protein
VGQDRIRNAGLHFDQLVDHFGRGGCDAYCYVCEVSSKIIAIRYGYHNCDSDHASFLIFCPQGQILSVRRMGQGAGRRLVDSAGKLQNY